MLNKKAAKEKALARLRKASDKSNTTITKILDSVNVDPSLVINLCNDTVNDAQKRAIIVTVDHDTETVKTLPAGLSVFFDELSTFAEAVESNPADNFDLIRRFLSARLDIETSITFIYQGFIFAYERNILNSITTLDKGNNGFGFYNYVNDKDQSARFHAVTSFWSWLRATKPLPNGVILEIVRKTGRVTKVTEVDENTKAAIINSPALLNYANTRNAAYSGPTIIRTIGQLDNILRDGEHDSQPF